MNILCVSHTPDLKGSAISLSELMKGMDRSLFVPIAAFSKDGPLIPTLKESGIGTHVVKRRGVLRIGTIREALEVIDRDRIDLVHLNSAVSFSKYFGIAARWRGLPVVWHVREDPDGKRVRSLKKWICFLSTRIIVLTTQQERIFQAGGKVIKVYNGVDTGRFQPNANGAGFRERFDLPEDAFVFGIVGSIEENKGTLNFLKASQLLRETDGEVRFVVVGSGLSEDIRLVREFVNSDSSLASRTVFTGKLAEMPEVMCGLDVLVVASRWESFPRVILESMACGKPAIAPAVGEIPMIIEAGKTGFLIPDNSVPALREAMLRCLRERNGLPEMGKAALEKARREFTIEAHVRKVEEIYRQVLNLGGRPLQFNSERFL